MRSIHRSFFIIILALTLANNSPAQEAGSDIRKEIESLKQGQEAILKSLNEIKSLLSQRPSAPNVPQPNIQGVELDITGRPISGSNAAKLVLIEITDYQCQFCGQYFRETLPQIVKRYVESGKLSYAMIDMPLPNHKQAAKAAEAAHCANEQGKYWEMHNQLMQKQDSLDDLSAIAKPLDLDIARFQECLKTNKYSDEVRNNISLGIKLGISAVPGFILAARNPEKPTIVKGISASFGFRPFDAFQPEIDQALEDLQK